MESQIKIVDAKVKIIFVLRLSTAHPKQIKKGLRKTNFNWLGFVAGDHGSTHHHFFDWCE
jgi:hypothetical protein